MNYLHTYTPPIIHRDLKSMNLLVDNNNTSKIPQTYFQLPNSLAWLYLPYHRELCVAPGVPRIIRPKFCAPTFIPFLAFLATSMSMSLYNQNKYSSTLRRMFPKHFPFATLPTLSQVLFTSLSLKSEQVLDMLRKVEHMLCFL